MALLKLATLLATMAAVTTGLALPESVVPAVVEAPAGVEDVISVTMYADINLSGTSATYSITTQSQCYGLEGTGMNNVISSISIPKGYRCRLWDSNHCDKDSTSDIYAPGSYQIANSMNDRATSFKCYLN